MRFAGIFHILSFKNGSWPPPIKNDSRAATGQVQKHIIIVTSEAG